MLDPLPIGTKESSDVRNLKCENCGMSFDEIEFPKDCECIDENGLCTDCYAVAEGEEKRNQILRSMM